MSLIRRMLKQRCVYWAFLQTNRFGQPVFAPPIEISCRWEDRNEEFISAAGTNEVSSARVFVSIDGTLVSNTDVTPNGYLWAGNLRAGVLETLKDYKIPGNNPGANAIKAAQKIPDIRIREALRICFL